LIWFGFLAFLVFLVMSEELARCTNPQPGRPGDFWSRFYSSSPWYINIKLPGSSASFSPPRVFYFTGTHHIWWAFPYPPPGELPDGRLANSHREEWRLVSGRRRQLLIYRTDRFI